MKKLLAVAALILSLLSINSIEVGAQSIQPCYGGSGGWFNTSPPPGQSGGAASINCSIQGNHIVVDLWYGGTRAQGVIDMWHDPAVAPTFATENGTFNIRFNTVSSPTLIRPWFNMNEMSAPIVNCCQSGYYYGDMIKLTDTSYVRTHQAQLVNWDRIGGVVTWNATNNPYGFTDVWPRGVNNNPYFRAGVKLDARMVDYSWYDVSTSRTWVWRATG